MVGGASRAVRSDGHRNASVRAVLSLCSVQPEGPLGIYSGRAAVPPWHLLHDEYHSTVRDIFSRVQRSDIFFVLSRRNLHTFNLHPLFRLGAGKAVIVRLTSGGQNAGLFVPAPLLSGHGFLWILDPSTSAYALVLALP